MTCSLLKCFTLTKQKEVYNGCFLRDQEVLSIAGQSASNYFRLMLLGLYHDIAVCCSVPYSMTTYSRGEFPQKHSFTFLVNPPQPQFCILWSIAGTIYYSKTPPGVAWLCKIRALFRCYQRDDVLNSTCLFINWFAWSLPLQIEWFMLSCMF